MIYPCSEQAPQDICTPTVVSTFINRITLNYPFFGNVALWAQFGFLGLFGVVAATGLVWTPRFGGSRTAEDDDLEEEESLLGASGRRTSAAWEDLTGRASGSGAGLDSNGYGAVNEGGHNVGLSSNGRGAVDGEEH